MITITKGSETLSFKSWVFPDQAIGVRLDTDNHRFHDARFEGAHGSVPADHTTIWARIQSSADIMELVMVVDALRGWDEAPIHLVLPLCPYSRQDRRCVKGESFSLRAFARLINGLGFARVTIFDAHSDVAAAVLDNVNVIPQSQIIGAFDKLNARLQPTNPADRPVFISPDAGANKRVAELAALYGHESFIRADKLRDLATGKIKEIVVVNPREEVESRKCLIVDDIGDRCGTFIGLAKALKAKGAASVELYITHGLFTAEIDSILDPLCEAGVSHIWTSNSYRTDLNGLGKQNLITVLNLESVFLL